MIKQQDRYLRQSIARRVCYDRGGICLNQGYQSASLRRTRQRDQAIYLYKISCALKKNHMSALSVVYFEEATDVEGCHWKLQAIALALMYFRLAERCIRDGLP